MKIKIILFTLALAVTATAQSKLQLKVHHGAGVTGYDVNSTMISGEKDMLVIDPQFSLSEAHRLAAEILESKKNLVTIYVTHPHPDHLFGLAVLHQAFPSARIVALPATVNAAKTGWPARQKFWFPTYGNNIPGPEPVLPEELDYPRTHPRRRKLPDYRWSARGRRSREQLRLYSVPQSGGDGRYHVRPRLLWCSPGQSPRKLVEDDGADRRVESSHHCPGHEGPGATRDLATLAFMKKYIADWDANVAASHDAAEMRTKVLKQYPGLGMEFTLNDRVATYFPSANKGK
jgi:Zn-dependent hydrolases, including glyoxylases